MACVGSHAAGQHGGHDALVHANFELVKRIAHHLSARLPSTVEFDDLLQAGQIGLLNAARNFDPGKGASFETYAGIRIRGAMLDEVRQLDWAPRSVHLKHRQVSEAGRAIEGETGRAAAGREIAARLGIGMDEYHDILADSAGCRLSSLEQPGGDDEVGRELPAATATPDEEFVDQQLRRLLVEAIRNLPEREALVLSLYYEREMYLRDIGAVLGVSESRVSQIHGQALRRLRAMTAEQ